MEGNVQVAFLFWVIFYFRLILDPEDAYIQVCTKMANLSSFVSYQKSYGAKKKPLIRVVNTFRYKFKLG